jgi:drug/metabolite transporter (DMT)-like permease
MDITNEKNAQGIILMVFSMGAFAIADTLIKMVSAFISPAQVMFFLIGGGLVVFTLIAKLQGERLIDHRALAPNLLVRYLAEVIGMIGMILALTYVPLSTVGAILQATPFLVALGAVLFLGEKVSWRRWSSIALGFVGVLLIVQPGAEGFDMTVLWALISVVGLSVRDLTTRLTPPDMTSSRLAAYAMAAAIPFAIGWVLFNGDSLFPTQANWVMVFFMVGLGSLGYIMLIASIRLAQVSIVSPFRYSRLIFLLIMGVVFFDERPNVLMLCGALLIIVSSIYMMWREQRAKQTRLAK